MLDPDAAADNIGNVASDPGSGGSGGGGGTDDMGIDASLQQTDPELYLALRESWEAARQTAETQPDPDPAADVDAADVTTPSHAVPAVTDDPDSLTAAVTDDVMHEDEELRRAIEMSMAAVAGGNAEEEEEEEPPEVMQEDEVDEAEDLDEDEAMARALAMSM
jgi:hypothetical protein